MQNLKTNKKGLTLVEVVVAMVLVTIASLAILAAVSQSAVFGGKADTIYTASIIAQKRIDLLKKFSFADIADIASEVDTAIDVDGDGVTDFKRTTEVTENYDGYGELLKIKVTVHRKEDRPPEEWPSVEMETLMSDVEGY